MYRSLGVLEGAVSHKVGGQGLGCNWSLLQRGAWWPDCDCKTASRSRSSSLRIWVRLISGNKSEKRQMGAAALRACWCPSLK